MQAAGLKVATQKYEYTSAGIVHQGENIYGIIHAPRGDATEAIVLVAAWKTADDELNLKGVTLALTLARYFKRELLPGLKYTSPSKDINNKQDGRSGPRTLSSYSRRTARQELRLGLTRIMTSSQNPFSPYH